MTHSREMGRIAYTVILEPGHGYILGIAEEGVAGYTPDERYGVFKDHAVAKGMTEMLNTRLELSPKEVCLIVLSSIGAQHKARRTRSDKGKKR